MYQEAGLLSIGGSLFGMVYKTCCELTAKWLSGTVKIIRELVQVPNLKLKSLFMTDIQQSTHSMTGKLSKIVSCIPSSRASCYMCI